MPDSECREDRGMNVDAELIARSRQHVTHISPYVTSNYQRMPRNTCFSILLRGISVSFTKHHRNVRLKSPSPRVPFVSHFLQLIARGHKMGNEEKKKREGASRQMYLPGFTVSKASKFRSRRQVPCRIRITVGS